jgi:predicted O-methyltransferase YrrM
MPKTLTITPELHDYVVKTGVREHPELANCRQATMDLGRAAGMQIAPEQGAFMALFAQSIGAKRCVEVGTFTGYSALAVALALPDDGTIDACDISAEYMARAKGHWAAAGVAHKINAHAGPAADSLKALLAKGGEETYDFAFIDADKANYDTYYELCLRLLRRGGVAAIDNVLWSGAVVDDKVQDADTQALRAISAKLHADARVDIAMATIADGLYLARKR